MFDRTGKPIGYDQIAPGRDRENYSTPGQPGRPPEALQQAITGAPQYPTDPSLQRWRQQPVTGQKIQPQVQPEQPQMPPALHATGGGFTGPVAQQSPQAAQATGHLAPNFTMPQGVDVATAMQQANQVAYGYAKHNDPNYWAAMWQKDPGYAWDRMIGKGAGAQDAAPFGPFAGGDPSAQQHMMSPLLSAIGQAQPQADPNSTLFAFLANTQQPS